MGVSWRIQHRRDCCRAVRVIPLQNSGSMSFSLREGATVSGEWKNEWQIAKIGKYRRSWEGIKTKWVKEFDLEWKINRKLPERQKWRCLAGFHSLILPSFWSSLSFGWFHALGPHSFLYSFKKYFILTLTYRTTSIEFHEGRGHVLSMHVF